MPILRKRLDLIVTFGLSILPYLVPLHDNSFWSPRQALSLFQHPVVLNWSFAFPPWIFPTTLPFLCPSHWASFVIRGPPTNSPAVRCIPQSQATEDREEKGEPCLFLPPRGTGRSQGLIFDFLLLSPFGLPVWNLIKPQASIPLPL